MGRWDKSLGRRTRSWGDDQSHGRRVRPRHSTDVDVIRLLPDDIIACEIFVRLPIRSLLKCKCLSKSWHTLISSPGFIDFHAKRAKKTASKLLITSVVPSLRGQISMHSYDERERRKRSRFLFAKQLPQLPNVLWLPQHSNGLVLLNTIAELIVCNPSTRDYVTLPKGSDDARAWPRSRRLRLVGRNRAGFGFVPSINAYKVGQYFYRSCDVASGTWSMGFEVFTLGVDSCWRATEEELPYPVDGHTPASVGDSIYFEMDKSLYTTTSSPDLSFFSFNLTDEKFRIISLPPNLPVHTISGFAELEGDTCFYTLSSGGMKFDTWIKNIFDNSWTHVFHINLLRPAVGVYPVAVRNGDLLLRIIAKETRDFNLVCYNHQIKSLKAETQVNLAADLAYYNPQQCRLSWFDRDSLFQVTSYVESLAPANPTIPNAGKSDT